jgi:CheY-like chemotaxis protein
MTTRRISSSRRVLLQAEGYVVRTAVDADQALQMLNLFRPDLILMDIQLPGMDGLELARRLKADSATRRIPIVALTAYAMKGDDQKTTDPGCDGYIAKPIDTRSLPRLVTEFLSKRTRMPNRKTPGTICPDAM